MDNKGLVGQGADFLPPSSRYFYERAIFKIFLSIVYFAVAIFFLGICAAGKFILVSSLLKSIANYFILYYFPFLAGGKSQGYMYTANATSGTFEEQANHAASIGYGN